MHRRRRRNSDTESPQPRSHGHPGDGDGGSFRSPPRPVNDAVGCGWDVLLTLHTRAWVTKAAWGARCVSVALPLVALYVCMKAGEAWAMGVL